MGDMHLGIYNFFCLKLLIFRLFSFLPKDLVVVDYVLTWKQLLDFGFILNTKKTMILFLPCKLYQSMLEQKLSFDGIIKKIAIKIYVIFVNSDETRTVFVHK